MGMLRDSDNDFGDSVLSHRSEADEGAVFSAGEDGIASGGLQSHKSRVLCAQRKTPQQRDCEKRV